MGTRLRRLILLLLALGLFLATDNRAAHACACGCGVFDVQLGSLFPTHRGGMYWLEYDFMDQDQNWHGSRHAPASHNDDKDIRTHFITAGVQYTFNQSWGASAEIPMWDRHFETADDSPTVMGFNHFALGDIRLKGIYTGLSRDASSGITFGLKLPTGDSSFSGFDPDTEIGTGSTDLLLGAYHVGKLPWDGRFTYFVNGQLQASFLHKDKYRPGSEVDGAVGVAYNDWHVGRTMVHPLVQLLGTIRNRDGGPEGDSENSGSERLLIAPGVDVHTGPWHILADVALPIYQRMNGNQLVAHELVKLNISHTFR